MIRAVLLFLPKSISGLRTSCGPDLQYEPRQTIRKKTGLNEICVKLFFYSIVIIHSIYRGGKF